MSGLWRYSEAKAPEGKYLVTRRDGTVPEWPNFVIGAKDPAAFQALSAYADAAEELNYDPQYVSDVRRMAEEFASYCAANGAGDPDAPPHRKDDPATIERMKSGGSLVNYSDYAALEDQYKQLKEAATAFWRIAPWLGPGDDYEQRREALEAALAQKET